MTRRRRKRWLPPSCLLSKQAARQACVGQMQHTQQVKGLPPACGRKRTSAAARRREPGAGRRSPRWDSLTHEHAVLSHRASQLLRRRQSATAPPSPRATPAASAPSAVPPPAAPAAPSPVSMSSSPARASMASAELAPPPAAPAAALPRSTCRRTQAAASEAKTRSRARVSWVPTKAASASWKASSCRPAAPHVGCVVRLRQADQHACFAPCSSRQQRRKAAHARSVAGDAAMPRERGTGS